MDQAKPLISILTPTWNRAAYLDRVWNGLNSQTYTHFEWIVCDDGSTDDTEAKLSELIAKSTFPITVITASAHIGKARMDNEAIRHAQGEFIIWNDSDDYLLPQALEQLMATWNSIPEVERKDYVGVTALCASEQGLVLSQLPVDGTFDTTWNDLRERLMVGGDMVYFTCASALKKNPFPEVDFVVPEGIVWSTIGEGKTRMHPAPIKVVEYRAQNCISFSRKMEYCRGRAYAISVNERNLKKYPKRLPAKLWSLITFIRCSIHGELDLQQILHLWRGNSSTVLVLLLWPIARMFALKDSLQNKVHKTHRDFDVAAKLVTLDVKFFQR